jgi:serine/threonine protein kinase
MEVIQKTLEGNYKINDKRWSLISSEAKDLVTKLLENDPNDRISID